MLGPSLPSGLVVWSQSLGETAHLCEALRAVAHPAFLRLFDLGEDVADLPLSQLQGTRGGLLTNRAKAFTLADKTSLTNRLHVNKMTLRFYEGRRVTSRWIRLPPP